MSEDGEPPPGGKRVTGVRYQVLALAVVLAAVTYLDRVCIAQTAPEMMRELGMTKVQMAFVFSAFTLAYALFEVPTGIWGDRIGTRRVLTRIVAWWSTFTILTAATYNYISLLVVRFLFGMGEAGAFPNASRTFSRWFPIAERGKAQGIFFAGAHLGGGLTPLLVVALMQVLSWRMVFAVFGMAGFVWAVVWFRWFRDEPADHPAVGPEEREYIESGRLEHQHYPLSARGLARVVTDRNVLVLCLMYFTQAYGFYFNITWLTTYLEKVRGFSSLGLGLMAGLPLLLSALADVLGGLATDRASRAFGLRVGRCGIGGAALLVAGTSLIAGVLTEDAYVAAFLIATAGASASFLLGAAWGVCLDIAGTHAGLVTGAMNTAGQIGAVISPIILAFFLKDGAEDWATPLYITGFLYLIGAACWLFVDPRRSIETVLERA